MFHEGWAEFGHFLAVYYGGIVAVFCLRHVILWIRPKIIARLTKKP